MVLVEAIVPDQVITPTEPPAKLRKLEPEDINNTHWTVGDTSQSAVVGNFLMANQCWQIFYSCEVFERGKFLLLIQFLSFNTYKNLFTLPINAIYNFWWYQDG